MSGSLRHRLTWRLVSLMLLFSLLASAVGYQLARKFSDEAYDEWLLDSARTLTQLVQLRDGQLVFDQSPPTLRAFVFDAHDRVLFRLDDSVHGFIAGHTNLPAWADLSAHDTVYQDVVIDGLPMRAVQVVRQDLQPGVAVRVMVAETLLKRERLASRVLGTFMALSALLALVTVWLARNVLSRGLAPLQALSDGIRQRPPGDLTRLPQTPMARELSTFTEAINGLLARLDGALTLQRRFIADAAHQLRTPLAALKVELEYAVREADPERHRQALVQLRGGLDRLSRLTHQLLTLARAEPGALADGSFQLCDWRALCHELGMRQLRAHLDADQDLAFDGERPVWVRGDALLLQELLANVLDNARRYAGGQAQVTVHIDTVGDRAVLTVTDTGPGVPEAELGRLAERFHRAPGAAPGGSGLGLAIVDEIARLHGGTLVVAEAAPHGLRVTVALPACAAPVHSSVAP